MPQYGFMVREGLYVFFMVRVVISTKVHFDSTDVVKVSNIYFIRPLLNTYIWLLQQKENDSADADI